ncbi:MAG: hypothetical protein WBA23_22120 [Tunicatimonas sp.]|uniref:hypothetical protein n=1 Tax=Tunicatimonas sp. TaxID=1940096 RepID=UPI003C709C0E
MHLLANSELLADQCVYVDLSEQHEHNHVNSGEKHQHDEAQLKTDKQGLVSVDLTHAGQ